jgi:hypothetical protein
LLIEATRVVERGWVDTESGSLVDEIAACGSPLGSLADADYECRHGRLAGDVCPSPRVVATSGEFGGRVIQNWPHPHPCGCWPQEQTPTPDLMGVFSEQEKLVEATTVPSAPAPFGYKADGTPRKRPAPSPEQLAAANAGRQRAQARRAVESPILTRMIGELDTEITRLQLARTKLTEALAA